LDTGWPLPQGGGVARTQGLLLTSMQCWCPSPLLFKCQESAVTTLQDTLTLDNTRQLTGMSDHNRHKYISFNIR
jgi:hypothetical protein